MERGWRGVAVESRNQFYYCMSMNSCPIYIVYSLYRRIRLHGHDTVTYSHQIINIRLKTDPVQGTDNIFIRIQNFLM